MKDRYAVRDSVGNFLCAGSTANEHITSRTLKGTGSNGKTVMNFDKYTDARMWGISVKGFETVSYDYHGVVGVCDPLCHEAAKKLGV